MQNLVNDGLGALLSASGPTDPAPSPASGAAEDEPLRQEAAPAASEAASSIADAPAGAKLAPLQAEGDASPEKKKKKKHKHKMRIEHKTLGRVRMKFASAKGDEAQLQEIAKTFGVIPGVQRVTVNPDTGSVVLHYDHERHDDFHRHFERHCSEHMSAPPKTQLDELADKIEGEAEFLAQHSHSAKALLHICKHFDHEIKRSTNNMFDLKIGLAGGLIVVTLFEVGATAATPIWLTLGVFTLNHFLELQQRHQLVEHLKQTSAPVVVKTKAAS
ncbi:MAG TPA: hypothetical protein VEH76_03615 [Methylocystis sp.]|nr:hypothetical protein [Methylocystis sp.]